MLAFENVDKYYDDYHALKGISATIERGEVVVVCGPSGSGKSTLIRTVTRLEAIHGGCIRFEGRDVHARDVRVNQLRARIGFVPQKATLFTGTIAANIRYGREDASDEEVRHAAEVAQALEFIRAMPDGFEAQVSQGGTNLSGGQKQRLAIARALVRRPDIYVFDDSSSALDVATDARLRAALASETAQSAVVVVSQRISTVVHADRIVVLDNGRVAGVGTHADLVERCAVYREIVDSQVTLEDVA